jgi:ABC-type amino acid transport substrate-binding protein
VVHNTRAEEYHFVSIENLAEQEIGRIVLTRIYASMGIDITITPFPAKRAQMLAITGRSVGEIMRIYTYGEENPTVRRVPTPYYYLETTAFIKPNSSIKITSKDDLRNYILAKVRGVKHTNNITVGMENVINLNSTEQVMRFVSAGRADVGLTNTIDGLMTISKLNLNLVPINKPLAKLNLFNYIHKNFNDLVPLVDEKIKELKANGELTRIIEDAENTVLERR